MYVSKKVSQKYFEYLSEIFVGADIELQFKPLMAKINPHYMSKKKKFVIQTKVL